MSATPTVAEIRIDSPLDAFNGTISPSRLSVSYRIGLGIVAFAMVLLPALYLTLIGAAAWGVVYHLGHNTWIMSGSGGGLGKLLLYVGPAVAGAILVFFMLKPLFARRQKSAELLSLDPAKEPVLFAFVERICRQVGAPMPCRIDVDCQVNASASLGRGLLSKDLVLTIGLPLVTGLDMRQFAGVLAHEFGHFAQGAGMRLTYVIRYINFWFARVVYERDKWDVGLEQTAKSVDLRLGVVLHAARGCVWLTRRILWALMHAGTAISCFMLRQMEYDADSYEAKLAGSSAFESTASRLQVLNAATQAAFEDVRQSWAGNRLPENLPLLVGHKAGSFSNEVQEKLAGSAASAKTGWFDTHPCDADRVKCARALNERGIFQLERPSAELLSDFAGTCKAVTQHQYEKHWELEFTAQNLVSSEEMLRESAANTEADKALRGYYGEINISLCPLLVEGGLPEVAGPETALAQWREARQQSDLLRPDGEKASAQYVEQQQKLVDYTAARHLTAVGFKIAPKEFGLPEEATAISEQEKAAIRLGEEASKNLKEQLTKLEQFMVALRNRLSLALRLGRERGPEWAAELGPLAEALAAVAGIMPTLHQVAIQLRPFTLLAENRGNHSSPGDVEAEMRKIGQQLRKLVAEIDGRLGGIQYPFPHPRGSLTIAQYAHYEKPCENELEAMFRESDAHVDRLFALHYRLLGRVVVLASQAEKSLESEPALAGVTA